MSANSDLIQKLIRAEEEAESVIRSAKNERSAKMQQIKKTAEEDLVPFKMREEAKYQEDLRAMSAKGNITAELEKQTQMELAMVNQAYEQNKKNAIKYILDKVLDIDLTVPATMKVQMMAA